MLLDWTQHWGRSVNQVSPLPTLQHCFFSLQLCNTVSPLSNSATLFLLSITPQHCFSSLQLCNIVSPLSNSATLFLLSTTLQHCFFSFQLCSQVGVVLLFQLLSGFCFQTELYHQSPCLCLWDDYNPCKGFPLVKTI